MALEVFTGRDGSLAAFPWLVDTISGQGSILVVKLDVGGDGSQSLLSASAPLPSYTPPDGSPLTVSGTTIGTTSGTVIAANASRKRIDVSNGSTTAGLWVRPGGGTAVAGQGWYLPPQAQASYYTTAALSAIGTATGITVGYVEW